VETDQSGAVGVRYRYDPYGNDRGTSGAFLNRLRFTANTLTTLVLYHMGPRLYRREIGRWAP
jgi:hypothetical protein